MRGLRKKHTVWPLAPIACDCLCVFGKELSFPESESPPRELEDNCVSLVGAEGLGPVCGMPHPEPGTQKVGGSGEGWGGARESWFWVRVNATEGRPVIVKLSCTGESLGGLAVCTLPRLMIQEVGVRLENVRF